MTAVFGFEFLVFSWLGGRPWVGCWGRDGKLYLILRYRLGCVNVVGGEGSVPDFPGMSESGLLSHGTHTRSRSSLPIHVQQLSILTNSQPLTEIIDVTEQLEYAHH